MTCIVGIQHAGKVYIAGDSLGSNYVSSVERGDSKVFRNGSYIFGFTSSFRMGQIIRYGFTPPECHDWDVERFMSTTFVKAIKEGFKEHGYGTDKVGGTFLVGYRGRLFKIQDDFQVGWNALPFDSCGSGAEVATGSLYSTMALDPDHSKNSIEQKLDIALDAATAFNPFVGGAHNHINLS